MFCAETDSRVGVGVEVGWMGGGGGGEEGLQYPRDQRQCGLIDRQSDLFPLPPSVLVSRMGQFCR